MPICMFIFAFKCAFICALACALCTWLPRAATVGKGIRGRGRVIGIGCGWLGLLGIGMLGLLGFIAALLGRSIGRGCTSPASLSCLELLGLLGYSVIRLLGY